MYLKPIVFLCGDMAANTKGCKAKATVEVFTDDKVSEGLYCRRCANQMLAVDEARKGSE